MVSRLSAIFTCLLALLVASPLCCCATERLKDQRSCCCCSGEKSPEKPDPDHRCHCASDDPREIPDPALIPTPVGGASVSCPPESPVVDWKIASVILDHPRWTPCLPWHAPPAERRARLVSRTL